MKNILLAATLAVIICSGLAGCSKCQTCTKASVPEVKICNNEYDNDNQRNAMLDSYKVSGYNCIN